MIEIISPAGVRHQVTLEDDQDKQWAIDHLGQLVLSGDDKASSMFQYRNIPMVSFRHEVVIYEGDLARFVIRNWHVYDPNAVS
jgi:hypothetical protein